MISFFHARGKRGFRRFERGFTHLEMAVVVGILAVLSTILIIKATDSLDSANVTVARSSLDTVRDGIMGTATTPGLLADMKYMEGFDTAKLQLQVRDLLDPSLYPHYNPVARRGWRGPYLGNVQPVLTLPPTTHAGLFPDVDDRQFSGDLTYAQRGFYGSSGAPLYGVVGDMAAADPWGNPMVVQVPPASEFPSGTSDEERFRFARVVSAGPNGVLNTPLNRLGGMLNDGTTAVRGDDIVVFLNRADVYE